MVSQSENEGTLPKSFVKHGLDDIDIYIINKLHDKTYGWNRRKELTADQRKFLDECALKPWKREGASLSTLNSDIAEELGIKLSRGDVETRVELLVKKGIIISLHALVINPFTLYDHVLWIFWKIPLSQAMRPYGWWDIKKLWDIDKTEKDSSGKVLDLIRILMVPEGTGEYDFISLIYTNDLTKHSTLLERLHARGFLVASSTQRVWEPTGMFFDPIKIPDYDSYVATFEEHYQKISRMRRAQRITDKVK